MIAFSSPLQLIIQRTGGCLTEIHLTFSVDQNFLLIWAFDRNFYFFILVSWSNLTWSFQLIKTFINVILKFRSTAKIRRFLFGSWSKVLIMVFYAFKKFRSTAKIRRFFFGSWSNFSINWKVSKILVNWLWKFWSTDKTQFWSTDFRSSDHSPFKVLQLKKTKKYLFTIKTHF